MKTLKYIVCMALFASVVSCTEETGGNSETGQDTVVEFSGINDKEWTYISLSTGKVVGKSPFGSVEGDELWRNRTDWDMALCGKYVRTNSGTSGMGEGGLLKVDGVSYESVTAPVSETFTVDEEMKETSHR